MFDSVDIADVWFGSKYTFAEVEEFIIIQNTTRFFLDCFSIREENVNILPRNVQQILELIESCTLYIV